MYDMIINMADLSTETAAQLIANAAQDVVASLHTKESEANA